MKKMNNSIVPLFIIIITFLFPTFSYSQFDILNNERRIYFQNNIKIVYTFLISDIGKSLLSKSDINTDGTLSKITNYDFVDMSPSFVTEISYLGKSKAIETTTYLFSNEKTFTEYFYNTDGYLIKVLNDGDVSTFEFDIEENILYEHLVQVSGGYYDFYYIFDNQNRLSSLEDKGGYTKYIYNSDNLLLRSLTYYFENNDCDDAILAFEESFQYHENNLFSFKKIPDMKAMLFLQLNLLNINMISINNYS